MAGYMLWMCNTHSIGQDSSSCNHLHSAAGRGRRLGHDMKWLNENDLRCIRAGDSLQEVKLAKWSNTIIQYITIQYNNTIYNIQYNNTIQ